MLKIFRSESEEAQLKSLASIPSEGKGLWIEAISPSSEEVKLLSETFNIEEQAFEYPLDEMEGSRIEQEDNYTLIITNYPVIDEQGYDTRALGIILTDRAIITVTKHETEFLNKFSSGRIRTFSTIKKGRFVFQILYNITSLFVNYLTQMGKKLDTAEERIKHTTSNEELIKLMSMNNSLAYFSTSLRGNQTVFEKIARSDPFRIYEEDRDLLEDTIIENRQSIDMTKTYINVLSSTMDAYASIVSNNLNGVMKFMTAWTIVIMVPTFIASLYGMNVKLPFADDPLAFGHICLICTVLTVVLILFFNRKRFF